MHNPRECNYSLAYCPVAGLGILIDTWRNAALYVHLAKKLITLWKLPTIGYQYNTRSEFNLSSKHRQVKASHVLGGVISHNISASTTPHLTTISTRDRSNLRPFDSVSIRPGMQERIS